MSRAKVEANNERKKNYKQYNRKAKRKRVAVYIPVIAVAVVLLLFLAFGGYTVYNSYRAENPRYQTVNLDAINNYSQQLQTAAGQ
ncbi:MAG: hypothetical protein K5644_02075 [Lachnospiraceae bacterium]|nr:hypothetical protein [Lachnospiraceae bacterium]